MALNPFFLQGSANEQRLIQELINEQLRIYGVEVTYIPRKFVRKETIIKEVTASKFDDNFALEAYVANYEGYSGSGDILTKFGMSLKDELTLIISKERFEDFISPFLEGMDDEEIELSTRPREGDIVYFPLGRRLFEIKFVEHEQPFYQLGKTYVYELKCELFEYEDEVLDTSIDEIDQTLQNQGYITSLQLISIGSTATASAVLSSGYVQKVYLDNDGYGYTSIPTVAISSAPAGGINARAVAITTSINGSYSIKDIVLTNAGAGYTIAPSITISGGGGSGAAATCGIQTAYNGIRIISIGSSGSGYSVPPTISISAPTTGPGIAASAFATLQGTNISQIYISNAGVGFVALASTITISPPPITSGTGNFIFNEEVVGSISGTVARVKSWDKDTNILEISINDGQFYPGEIIVGTASSARYSIKQHNMVSLHDKYQENDEIQSEADLIIDFSESNPFGNY
jgi:hypothetical protein